MTIDLTSRRRVGQTDLMLPPMGFGAAHVGGTGTRIPGDKARATFQAAWDGGIRHFDTAPYYGLGLSEHRLGDFLMDQPRDEFIVTTKVGRSFRRPDDPKTWVKEGWPTGLNFQIEFSYSYDSIMRAYEQSLLRLGLDTVDALLLHDPDASLSTPDIHAQRLRDLADGGIRALQDLKRGGQIKAIGMGINSTEGLEDIVPLVELDFCIVAMPYTLLDQSVLRSGMQRCIDKGISVIIGAPYASGILVTGPGPNARYRYQAASAEVQEKAGKIQAICRQHGVSLPAAALQFPLAHPAVVSVIPGGISPAEVNSNLTYVREPIPAALWADLKAANLLDPDAPVPA